MKVNSWLCFHSETRLQKGLGLVALRARGEGTNLHTMGLCCQFSAEEMDFVAQEHVKD